MPLKQDISELKITVIDRDKTLADLEQILKAAEKVSGVQININNGGLKGLIDAQNQLTQATQQGQAALQQYNSTVKANEAASRASTITQKQKIALDKAEAKELIAVQKEAEKLAKTKEREASTSAKEKKLIEDAVDEYKQLGIALKEAEQKYKQLYFAAGAGAKPTQEALQNALSIRKVLNTVDQSLGNYQRNVGNYASGFNGLNTSIQQILREAPSAAVSLNTFFLAISNNLPSFFDEIEKLKVAQAAANAEAKIAAGVAKEQAIAQALAAGQTQKAAVAEGLLAEKTILANAATAKGPGILKAIATSLFSLQSGLTVVVLLLTLFGSAAIAAVGSMAKSGAAMLGLSKKQDDLRKSQEYLKGSQEALNKAFESSEYAGAIEQISTLKTNIDLAKQGFLDKKDVLEQYNETIGKTTGQVKTLDEAEIALGKNADAYVKMTLFKAAAQEAAGEAAKKAVEAERIRIKELKDFANSAIDTRQNAGGIGLGGGAFNAAEYDAETKRIEKARKDRQAKQVKIADDASKVELTIAQDFQKKAAMIAKEFKFDFFPDKKDAKGSTEKIKTIADAIKELRQELQAIQKEQDNAIISVADADVKRVDKFKSTIEEIFKLKATDRAKDKAVGGLLPELNDITVQVIKRQFRELSKGAKQAFEEFKDFASLETLPTIEINVKPKLIKGTNTEQAYADALQAQQTFEALSNSQAELALVQRYASGKINRKQYEEDLLNLQEEYGKRGLQIQIDSLKAQERFAYDGVEQTADILKKRKEITEKVYALEVELGKKIIDNDDKTTKERLAKLTEFFESAQSIISEVGDIIGSVIDIGIAKQKNALQEVEDIKQENYEREVDRINKSTLNATEKETQLRALEFRRQAEKQKFDRENREADLKKARFNKAQNIADIILAGTLAVIKTLPEGLVTGLTYVVGALSAAKLAVAIATPLPKYAKGLKGDKPGHVGMYGEAGPEVYHEPGRAPVVVDRATVGFIPAGTTITPIGRDEINGILYRGMAKQTAGMMNKQDTIDPSIYVLQNIEQGINRMVRKRSGSTVNINLSSRFAEEKYKYYKR